MVKKRRLLVRVKPKIRGSKSPQTDGDDVMNSARQKFKGALQDLLPHSEEDSTSDEDNHHWNNAIKKARREASGSKRSLGEKGGGVGEGFRNSFIMKLFDRTVDLSSYTESTPLYPICRAWIKNSSLYSFSRKMDDVKEEGKSNTSDDMSNDLCGDIKHSVTKLPSPTHYMEVSEKLRVPKPIPYVTNYDTLPQLDETSPSRDELLADNLAHWSKVRQSWREASKINEQRYSQSMQILTNIFNNAQKTF